MVRTLLPTPPSISQDDFTAEVGAVTVNIFHNGYLWVMRFCDASGKIHNRLVLGQHTRQLVRLRGAFDRGLFGFHSQFPFVMVGGIQFSVFEARAMRDLLARALAR